MHKDKKDERGIDLDEKTYISSIWVHLLNSLCGNTKGIEESNEKEQHP